MIMIPGIILRLRSCVCPGQCFDLIFNFSLSFKILILIESSGKSFIFQKFKVIFFDQMMKY